MLIPLSVLPSELHWYSTKLGVIYAGDGKMCVELGEGAVSTWSSWASAPSTQQTKPARSLPSGPWRRWILCGIGGR